MRELWVRFAQALRDAQVAESRWYDAEFQAQLRKDPRVLFALTRRTGDEFVHPRRAAYRSVATLVAILSGDGR